MLLRLCAKRARLAQDAVPAAPQPHAGLGGAPEPEGQGRPHGEPEPEGQGQPQGASPEPERPGVPTLPIAVIEARPQPGRWYPLIAGLYNVTVRPRQSAWDSGVPTSLREDSEGRAVRPTFAVLREWAQLRVGAAGGAGADEGLGVHWCTRTACVRWNHQLEEELWYRAGDEGIYDLEFLWPNSGLQFDHTAFAATWGRGVLFLLHYSDLRAPSIVMHEAEWMDPSLARILEGENFAEVVASTRGSS